MTIQIAGTSSNHYELIQSDGTRVQMVELILMGLETGYEITATGISRRDVSSTHRFCATLKQLEGVIQQFEDMLEVGREHEGDGKDGAK